MALDWTTVLQTLAVSLGGAGTVTVLSQVLAKHLLDKDVEKYRADLKREGELELARLRSTLEHVAIEHRVRFTRLHEKQAEIVADIFAGLDRLHGAMRDWTSPIKLGGDPDMPALQAEAMTKYNEFIEYYYPRAIWLDPDTCAAISNIVDGLRTAFYDFVVDTDEKGYPRDRRGWHAVYEKMARDIPAARNLLDVRFRQILGVPVSAAR
jgi:hypothetical protein